MKSKHVLELMKSKINIGWTFEKIYDHLLSIEDYRKINKEAESSNEYTTTVSDDNS